MTYLIDLADRYYYFEDEDFADEINRGVYQFLAYDHDNIHRRKTIGNLYAASHSSTRRYCVLWMDKDTGEQFADLMNVATLHNLFEDDDIDAIFEISDLRKIC